MASEKDLNLEFQQDAEGVDIGPKPESQTFDRPKADNDNETKTPERVEHQDEHIIILPGVAYEHTATGIAYYYIMPEEAVRLGHEPRIHLGDDDGSGMAAGGITAQYEQINGEVQREITERAFEEAAESENLKVNELGNTVANDESLAASGMLSGTLGEEAVSTYDMDASGSFEHEANKFDQHPDGSYSEQNNLHYNGHEAENFVQEKEKEDQQQEDLRHLMPDTPEEKRPEPEYIPIEAAGLPQYAPKDDEGLEDEALLMTPEQHRKAMETPHELPKPGDPVKTHINANVRPGEVHPELEAKLAP